ncbi:hypothetical protein PoB_001601100 [Plakobranchus ocellatus]|uniref:Uncharacterized protein n=1 Tax=Plakobranchus ocellatus TaxID=259542 RepID=A0AAV3Z0Z6_9GAST|nr:hypothetical protein PoB_001601100 [Plakobranchus ocellatus]
MTTSRGKAMERKRIDENFQDLRNVLEGVPDENVWNMNECGFNFGHNRVKWFVNEVAVKELGWARYNCGKPATDGRVLRHSGPGGSARPVSLESIFSMWGFTT